MAAHALHDQEQAHITAAPGKLLLSSSSSSRSLRSSRIVPPSSSLPAPIRVHQDGASMTKEQEDTLFMVLKNEKEGRKRSSSRMLPSQQPMSPPRSPLAPRSAPSSPQKRMQAIASAGFVDGTHEMEMEMDDDYEDNATTESQSQARPLPSTAFHTPSSATASASSLVTSAVKNVVASALSLATTSLATTSDASKVLALVTDSAPSPPLLTVQQASSSSSPWGLVNEEIGVSSSKPFERPSMRKQASLLIPPPLLLQQKLEKEEEEKEEETLLQPTNETINEGGGILEQKAASAVHSEHADEPFLSTAVNVTHELDAEPLLAEKPSLAIEEDVAAEERQGRSVLNGLGRLLQATDEKEDDANHANERLMVEEEEEEKVADVPPKRVRTTRSSTAIAAVDISKTRKRPLPPPLDAIKSQQRSQQPSTLLQQAVVKRTRKTATEASTTMTATTTTTMTVAAEASDGIAEKEAEPLVVVDDSHYLKLCAELKEIQARDLALSTKPLPLPPLRLRFPQPGFKAVHSNPCGLSGDIVEWRKTVDAEIDRANAVPDYLVDESDSQDDERENTKEAVRFRTRDYSSSLQTLHNCFLVEDPDSKDLVDDPHAKDSIASAIEVVEISSKNLKALKKGNRVVVVLGESKIELPKRDEAYFGKVGTRYCSRYPVCNPRARSSSRDIVFGLSSLQQLKKPSHIATVNEGARGKKREMEEEDEEEEEEEEEEKKVVMKPAKSKKKQTSTVVQEKVKKTEKKGVLSLGLRLTIADFRRKREEEGRKDVPPAVAAAANLDLSFKGSSGEDLKPQQRRTTRPLSVPLPSSNLEITKKSLTKVFEAEKN